MCIRDRAAERGDTADPLLAREISFLARYEIEEADTLRVQPCISPLWDTAIAMVSLEEAGIDPSHPALLAASRWLVDNQILGPGDWQVKNRDAEPGGWAFEFRNDFYPDVDDTAFVLMALGRVEDPEPVRLRASIRRGLAWLVSMQNEDGGWGAFDHENNLDFLNHIPFADHNAMLDPSTADVTALSLIHICAGALDSRRRGPPKLRVVGSGHGRIRSAGSRRNRSAYQGVGGGRCLRRSTRDVAD